MGVSSSAEEFDRPLEDGVKRLLLKVYDPDEKSVHLQAPSGLDQVTLCGQADWLENKSQPDYGTKLPLDCWRCIAVWGYCNGGRLPTRKVKA